MSGLWIPDRGDIAAVGEGEALGAAAVDVGDVELSGTGHGRRENDLRTIRRPCRGGIRSVETREGDRFSGVEGIHADLRAGDAVHGGEAGEGDAGSVGGPARGERDGFQGGELALVGAVVVHHPDFFPLRAHLADESDLS